MIRSCITIRFYAARCFAVSETSECVLSTKNAVSQLIRKGNRASDANSQMQIAHESVKVSPKV